MSNRNKEKYSSRKTKNKERGKSPNRSHKKGKDKDKNHSSYFTLLKTIKFIAVLHRSGVLKAYQELLRDLCRKGLPTGNIYEYAALQMLKAEKVYKAKVLKRDAVKRDIAHKGTIISPHYHI